MGEQSITIKEYDPALIRKRRYRPNIVRDLNSRFNFVIDHHLAHAISSWLYRPDDKERLFLAYDGSGSGPDRIVKTSLVGVISNDGFYKIDHALPIPSSMPVCSLLGYNSAGKAMGMAGYMPHIKPMVFNADNIMKLMDSCFDWSRVEPCFPEFRVLNPSNMEFVAGFYKFIINQIWKKIEENIIRFSDNRGIVVGGGTALALELNTRIYNMTGDLVFGPPINDSGLALGAAAFAYFHVHKKWPKLNTPAINDIQRPLPAVGPQEPLEIAKLIADNKIIGLLRGKSEAGPRALGFRSIFASAMKEENLKIVSEDIKEREFYRPLAPIVTSEAFERYFIGPKGKYMQYRCLCTEEARRCLPAVVHRDFSSRPQVVYQQDDPWLHEVLVEYGEITGHECFINTSLNRAGKPICNTFEDAQEDMWNKEVLLISIGQ